LHGLYSLNPTWNQKKLYITEDSFICFFPL